MPSTREARRKKSKYFKKRSKLRKKKVGHTVRVRNAILETLSYRSVFDYPMSFYQLNTFLISKKKVRPEVLQDALDYLVRNRKLGVKAGKYYLYKTKAVLWKKRYNNSVRLLERVDRITRILSRIPWVQFVGATGAVAAFNAEKDDDIDIFVVTKARRLWLTRGFVFVVLKILGQLRSDENPNRKICPNIFLEEQNLIWDKSSRNVYVAHEVIMLHPLFDRNQTYFRFLQKNDWAFNYFGNLSSPEYTLTEPRGGKNMLLHLVEELAYKGQLAYMKDKKTEEVTERNKIHFRKVDNTNRILDGFQKARSRVSLKSK